MVAPTAPRDAMAVSDGITSNGARHCEERSDEAMLRFVRNDGLRGPDGCEELVDLGLQPLVLVRQQLRRRQDLGGGRARVTGAPVDVGDGGRDLGGADRRLL